MAATAPVQSTTSCSFCIKAESDVAKLIAGPGVYICDGCVQLCVDILAADDGSSSPSGVPFWEEMTDEQILERLPRVGAVSAQVDASLQSLVDLLRRRGVAWVRIGAALGVTRQSAWERFSGED